MRSFYSLTLLASACVFIDSNEHQQNLGLLESAEYNEKQTQDNDEDGWIDALDPGCEASLTNEEPSNNPTPALCSNGEDDDGDGAVDGNDAQCENPYDDDESQ